MNTSEIKRASDHAVKRYRERASTKAPDDFIRESLIRMANAGRDVVLKKQFRIDALIGNGCRIARYIKSGRFILVVESDLIVTVHEGSADRWE